LSSFLAAAGVLLAAVSAATALLAGPGRLRSAAMLVAITLVPTLILGNQWHSHRIVDLRDHPARLTLALLAALGFVVLLALAFRRRPRALPLAIVFVLPFRVPLQAGGETANLLVPLYLVIAAGVLFAALRDWRAPAVGLSARGAAKWLPRVLAAVVVLYALQVLYSENFSKGLQDVCFFYVPFAMAYALLSDLSWDRKLLTAVLMVVGIEAVLLVVVGAIEYQSRSLFWNHQVIRSNEFHTYFRVNSVFWDPNIYGRYLALVIVAAMAALLWAKQRRSIGLLAGLVAILWIGLVPTFSQSSFIALLAGLAVLAALRWSWRWTLAVVGAGAVVALLGIALISGTSKIGIDRLNVDTSGRAHLVSGGVRLFDQRPLYGYGSGSFSTAYRVHAAKHRVPVSVSHTEPITIAAEQGLLGLALYVALIGTALWTMTQGASRSTAGRAAVLAAFLALLVHTMAYAGFYEDPITWVLLALGASLAGASAVRDPA